MIKQLLLLAFCLPLFSCKKGGVADKNPDFDAVIVAAGPCYGKCPINFIMIENTGKVTYTGVKYVDHEGFYTSKISTADFKVIMDDFKKAGYMSLDENLSSGGSDMSSTAIAFIKNGKIVKSITDYGNAGPAQFVSAYKLLTHLEQKLTLTRIKVPDQLQADTYIDFYLDGYYFTPAESFYLYYKLINGKITNEEFDKKYTFSYGSLSEKTYLKSDGRNFRVKTGNNFITIDTGDNFLKGNTFHVAEIMKMTKKHKNEQ